MNPEVKALWVKDLRENGDMQGIGFLSRLGKDCCLGRLCRLAIKEGLPVSERTDFMGEISIFSGMTADLPEIVNDWSRVDMPTDFVVTPQGNIFYSHFLAKMNDSGSSFDDIANWIEAKL